MKKILISIGTISLLSVCCLVNAATPADLTAKHYEKIKLDEMAT